MFDALDFDDLSGAAMRRDRLIHVVDGGVIVQDVALAAQAVDGVTRTRILTAEGALLREDVLSWTGATSAGAPVTHGVLDPDGTTLLTRSFFEPRVTAAGPVDDICGDLCDEVGTALSVGAALLSLGCLLAPNPVVCGIGFAAITVLIAAGTELICSNRGALCQTSVLNGPTPTVVVDCPGRPPTGCTVTTTLIREDRQNNHVSAIGTRVEFTGSRWVGGTPSTWSKTVNRSTGQHDGSYRFIFTNDKWYYHATIATAATVLETERCNPDVATATVTVTYYNGDVYEGGNFDTWDRPIACLGL